MAKPPVCGWKHEKAARKQGSLRIAGLDEVGRGPLFGPVVAAAVILAPRCRLDGLTDSKKLSEKKRDEFEIQIRLNAVAWAVAAVDVETIDRINIRRASLLAMRLAVESGVLARRAGRIPVRFHAEPSSPMEGRLDVGPPPLS